MEKVLVIGGAGFIGSNAADHYLEKGFEVSVFDNFSRFGTKENVKWLQKNHPEVKIIKGDIRTDRLLLEKQVKEKDIIIHLAAQTAVTNSLKNPEEDFDINLRGTFHLLESIRKNKSDATLIFSSTNKVYGELEKIGVKEKETRYEFDGLPFGIPETQCLEFNSPYSCSKGASDQYVSNYAKSYGLNTVVLRQSCIYGERQFGVEDQGWLSWFTIAVLQNKKITVYGNGKQIRDVLFVNDLVDCFELVYEKIKTLNKGEIFNVGGGPDNTLSLLELLKYLEELLGKKVEYSFSGRRLGDQPVFVSDIRKAQSSLGWTPEISVKEGLKRLVKWTKENQKSFPK